MTSEVACDLAVEDEDIHSCLREFNLDHWFFIFLCAAGLHSRLTLTEDGEDLTPEFWGLWWVDSDKESEESLDSIWVMVFEFVHWISETKIQQ